MKITPQKKIVLALFIAGSVLVAGCGMNLYHTMTPPKTTEAKIAEARTKIDDREYSDASAILSELAADDDSNLVRILWAASILGAGGLDIWAIFGDAIANLNSSTTTTGTGSERILSLISDSVLGADTATRTMRIGALRSAVGVLRGAPHPEDSKLNNTQCFLAGLLIVPTAADGTRLLEETQSALETVRTSSSAGGTVCPAIETFASAMTNLSLIQGAFSDVLEMASGCALLQGFLDESAASLNVAQRALSKLVTGADKGCSVPTDPELQALFPSCVMDVLQQEDNAGTAGDGLVSSCEFVTNCTGTSACF
jgi:hypothetical protein